MDMNISMSNDQAAFGKLNPRDERTSMMIHRGPQFGGAGASAAANAANKPAMGWGM